MATTMHWRVEWYGNGSHPACRRRVNAGMQMTTDPEKVTCKQAACQRGARGAIRDREANEQLSHHYEDAAVQVATPTDDWAIWLRATGPDGQPVVLRLEYNDVEDLVDALGRARNTMRVRDRDKYDEAWIERLDRKRLRAMTPEAREAELARRAAGND